MPAVLWWVGMLALIAAGAYSVRRRGEHVSAPLLAVRAVMRRPVATARRLLPRQEGRVDWGAAGRRLLDGMGGFGGQRWYLCVLCVPFLAPIPLVRSVLADDLGEGLGLLALGLGALAVAYVSCCVLLVRIAGQNGVDLLAAD